MTEEIGWMHKLKNELIDSNGGRVGQKTILLKSYKKNRPKN